MAKKIEPWGRQEFLNHAFSGDSGWLKFSIKSSTDEASLDVNAVLADCSTQIGLEFSVYRDNPRINKRTPEEDLEYVTTRLERRREKLRIFRETIEDFCDHLEEAYDDYETLVAKQIRDAKKAANAKPKTK